MGKLIDILPSGYAYSINNEPTTSFRMKLSTKSEIQTWLKKFEEKNFTTWRITTTYPKSSGYYIFKADYHCHHNTNKRVSGVRRSKNTNCPARIKFTIERYSEKVDNINSWRVGWPCLIKLNNEHNHPLQCASVLKYRDMSEETKQKLRDLYHRGHTPSSALHCLKTELLLKHTEDYFHYDGDGRYVPTLSRCAHLFNKEFKPQNGNRSGEEMFNDLNLFLEEYSATTGGRALSGTTDDGHVYVCICTLLMTRVHTMVKQSSEIVYVDAAGGMDRQQHRVYLMTTSTPAGGLPLAIIITDTEKEEVFSYALKELIRHCLPEESFFGQNYPTVIITDNDLKERKALQEHFADSTLLLCQFHVLKAMWAWLSNTTKHGIDKSDRQELFFMFKAMVYSRSEDELQEACNTLIESESTKKYTQYVEYVEKLWQEKEAWATCYRSGLPIRDTTSYVEAALRILKDVILQKVIAFNLTQLVDFLLTSYESYLQKRLLSFANDRLPKSLLKKFASVKSTIDLDEIKEHEMRSDCFTVPSETKQNVSYTVDINTFICECSHGNTGAVCKHISAAFKKLNRDTVYMAGESTVLSRKVMFEVATGKEPDDKWLLPLTSEVGPQPSPPQIHLLEETLFLEGTISAKERFLLAEQENSVLPQTSVPPQSTPPQIHVQVLEVETEPFFTEEYSVNDPAIIELVKEEIKNFCDDMIQGVETNPGVFIPAIMQMAQNRRKYASTEAGFVNALNSFATSRVPSLKRNRVGGPNPRGILMGVHVPAIGRRKLPLAGRGKLRGGRIAGRKSAKQVDHDYSGFQVPNRKSRAAKNDLQLCVDKNKGLGPKKSRKK